MDPVSQFAVGGVFGVVLAVRVHRALRSQKSSTAELPVAPAILCAGLAATTPDLDVLIRAVDYPLLALKYHRHFTHALLTAPAIAALLTLPLYWLFRRTGLGMLAVFLLALFGVLTHGPLDAMTNYGTHLFWPFTTDRTSWNLISIIDPIFTLTLLGAMLTAAWHKSLRPLYAACLFALLYWGAGWHQKTSAEQAMHQLAASRGHSIERYEVKPAFANILLWRAQYIYNNTIYTDAVQVMPGLPPKIYPGTQYALLRPAGDWLQQLPPAAQRDVHDFAFFSDGWLAKVNSGTAHTLIGDMRFAMLPNDAGPLWAINTSTLTASGHVRFVNLRQGTPNWARLWAMITRQD